MHWQFNKACWQNVFNIKKKRKTSDNLHHDFQTDDVLIFSPCN